MFNSNPITTRHAVVSSQFDAFQECITKKTTSGLSSQNLSGENNKNLIDTIKTISSKLIESELDNKQGINECSLLNEAFKNLKTIKKLCGSSKLNCAKDFFREKIAFLSPKMKLKVENKKNENFAISLTANLFEIDFLMRKLNYDISENTSMMGGSPVIKKRINDNTVKLNNLVKKCFKSINESDKENMISSLYKQYNELINLDYLSDKSTLSINDVKKSIEGCYGNNTIVNRVFTVKTFFLNPSLYKDYEKSPILEKLKSKFNENYIRDLVHENVSDDVTNSYTVRKDNWKQLYSANQGEYGRCNHLATLEVAKMIKTKEPFEILLPFLAINRRLNHFIGQSGKSAAGLQYGKLLSFQMDTALDSKTYESLGKALPKIISEYKNHDSSPCLEREEFKLEETTYQVYCVKAQINGEPVKLSKFVDAGDDKSVPTLFHTDPVESKRVMSYLPTLYDEIMNMGATNDDEKLRIKEKLGELFWWVCQAKPWELGDPSIAEMLIKAIWLAKTDTMLPAWTMNTIPWSEAMKVFDCHEFGRHFPSLIDNTYTFNKS